MRCLKRTYPNKSNVCVCAQCPYAIASFKAKQNQIHVYLKWADKSLVAIKQNDWESCKQKAKKKKKSYYERPTVIEHTH